MQRTQDDDLEGDFTGNFPVDPAGVGSLDHRAQVPEEKEITANTETEWKSITQFQLRIRSNKQNFHVGANEAQVFLASFGNITPENLGLAVKLSTDGKVNFGKTDYSTGTRNAGPLYQMNISVQTRESAEQAITIIDNALKKISLQRTSLGSMQNALEKTSDYIMHNRLYESESRIRDVDMAREMLNYTKTDILNQSGVTMLSHANSKHDTILQLLK
jgi:flagellin